MLILVTDQAHYNADKPLEMRKLESLFIFAYESIAYLQIRDPPVDRLAVDDPRVIEVHFDGQIHAYCRSLCHARSPIPDLCLLYRDHKNLYWVVDHA